MTPTALIPAPWYNVERVRQPGSVVLRQWVAKHGPEAQQRQKQDRHPGSGMRLYAGAQVSRLTSDWSPINTSADAELVTSLRLLRARSRQVCRDNEHAKNAVRIVANNVINTGIGLQATVKTAGGTLIDRVNAKIEEAFARWQCAETCHTAGRLHFHDIERLALQCVVRDGEVLLRKIRRPFGGSAIPLALELIEADRLVDHTSQAIAPGSGNVIRMGVELDSWMRPIAYWFHPAHPGDYQFSSATAAQFLRIPAEDIIHLHLIDRWPQTRGEPWFHATLKRLHNTAGYEEAEIVAARASAAIMGIITSPERPPEDGTDADGSPLTDLTPGTVHHLHPGEQFTGFSPSRPNAALEPFTRHMLRAVAAGIGCSYSALTKDYSQANYSSERAAQLEDRVLWRILQGWFIRSFRENLHREWLDAAILSGAVQIPDYYSNRTKYQAARFKPPGWSWIDPTKEVAAYKEAVRCGFMTVTDVIGVTANGVDPEDIFKSRRAELDLMAGLNLVFDTDPGAVNQSGTQQAEEATAQPASEMEEEDDMADEPEADETPTEETTQ